MPDIELIPEEDCYYLRHNGEESAAEAYGCALDYTFKDGRRALALVDVKPHTDDIEAVLDEWVYWVSGVPTVEILEPQDEEEEDETVEIEAPEEVEK